MPDPFDPRFLVFDAPERRIYTDDRASDWVVVDDEDYQWALQWKWNMKTCRFGKSYARRAVSIYAGGERLYSRTLYLHIEIAKRAGIVKPSPRHHLVDHRNGNERDARRENLRWVTHAQNMRNFHGQRAFDLFE